jgi:hypothetical protein
MVHRSDAATDPAASHGTIVDKNVRPASADQPIGSVAAGDPNKAASDLVDPASAAASMAAADLLNHALTPPKASPLAGSPLTLLQAIAPFAANRAAQLAIARAYWKLSAAQGDYNWAVEEADALEQISPGAAATDQTILATARASAQGRLLEAKLGAVTAQQELADLLNLPATNPLPLTDDPPLVGAYRTYFDTIYAGRVPPPRMRLIDRTLPIRREAIETHVAAVQAAASAVHATEDARAKGPTDLQNLLTCEADLSRQRRSFLASVRDYNLDIAEYALTVVEPGVPTERVIGMLIRLKPASKPSSGPASTSVPPADRPTGGNALMEPALPRGARPAPATAATGGGSPALRSNPTSGSNGAANPNGSTPPASPFNPIAPSPTTSPPRTIPPATIPPGTGPAAAPPIAAPPFGATPATPTTITPSTTTPPSDATNPFGPAAGK